MNAMPAGVVCLDLPLLMRLFELMREEVSSDADLHVITERLAARQMEKAAMLDMSDYELIAGESPSPATLEARRPPERKEKITIEGTNECVERVLALLAMISLNGSYGHSGTFAIPWDGDGADFVEIKGLDTKKYKDMVEAVGGYGGEVEMVGEGGAGFVGNVVPAEDEKSRPRISWKKVFPKEEVNASLRILAADNKRELEEQLDEICNEIERLEDKGVTVPIRLIKERDSLRKKLASMNVRNVLR